jgi:hypothetical protein
MSWTLMSGVYHAIGISTGPCATALAPAEDAAVCADAWLAPLLSKCDAAS